MADLLGRLLRAHHGVHVDAALTDLGKDLLICGKLHCIMAQSAACHHAAEQVSHGVH